MTQDTIQQEYSKRFAKIVDVTGFNDEYTREEYKLSKKDREIIKFIESIATTAREEERRNIAYNIESFLKCFPHLTLQEYAERTKLFTNNKTI